MPYVNPARAGMILTLMVNSQIAMSKPRASGDDPMTYCGQGLPVRVNPARAGMIRSAAGSPERTERKPRASGDDPFSGALDGLGEM